MLKRLTFSSIHSNPDSFVLFIPRRSHLFVSSVEDHIIIRMVVNWRQRSAAVPMQTILHSIQPRWRIQHYEVVTIVSWSDPLIFFCVRNLWTKSFDVGRLGYGRLCNAFEIITTSNAKYAGTNKNVLADKMKRSRALALMYINKLVSYLIFNNLLPL